MTGKKKEPERKPEKAEETVAEAEIVEEKVEEKKVEETLEKKTDIEKWQPKTSLGIKVKNKEIGIDEILDSGFKIMEPEFADMLLPEISSELLMVGQAKGKFGGGQRRIFRQTQKKTAEGNKPHFATCVVIGNNDGILGIGYGKSKETVPAREKAIRNAKLNLMKIRRGCGSWNCYCKGQHSIPFSVTGKCGSVTIKLMPAPKGTGLIVEEECQKILKAAGVVDVWSKTFGQTRTKLNLILACESALKKLSSTKVSEHNQYNLGIVQKVESDIHA